MYTGLTLPKHLCTRGTCRQMDVWTDRWIDGWTDVKILFTLACKENFNGMKASVRIDG